MALPILVFISLAMSELFKKKFEDIVGLAFFAIITILYLSGLVTTFIPGLLVIILMALVSVFFLAYIFLKDHSTVCRLLEDKAIWGFVILSGYFLVVSHARYLDHSDEFIHWGNAVKYYYLLSDYSNSRITTDQSMWYPPAATLSSYFFTRFWITCSTGMMYWGYQVFIVSILLPMFRKVKKSASMFAFGVLLLFILSLPYFPVDDAGNTLLYTNLGPDILIGVLLFYIIICFREYVDKGEKFYFIAALWGLFIITLVKQLGFVFAFLAIFVIGGLNIKRNYEVKKNVLEIILCIVSVMLAFGSWEIYRIALVGYMYSFANIAIAASQGKFALLPVMLLILIALVIFLMFSKRAQGMYFKVRSHIPEVIAISFSVISLVAIVKISKSLGVPLEEYVDFFFGMENLYIGYILHFPLALFALGLLIIMYFCVKDRWDKGTVYMTFYGFIMWCLFRTIAHIAFQSHEVSYLTSMHRYVYSYFLAIMLLVIYLLSETGSKQVMIGILVGTVILSNGSWILKEMVNQKSSREFRAIDTIDFDYGDKVFLVDTYIDDDRCEGDFYYQVIPASSNWDAYEATWYLSNNLEGRRLTLEEVSKKILDGGYNYVYIRRFDDGFGEYYSELFDNIDDLSEQHIYSVSNNNGLIKLTLYN